MAIQKPEDQPTLENNDIKSFPKKGFGNLNAPPGYSWTPKWKDGPTISRGRLEQMRASNAGSVGWDKGNPVYNPPGAPDLPRTEPGEVADWDYQTSKTGKYGEELPKRAVGWKKDGSAYYGPDNFYSTFNKMLDRTDETIAFTRSDEFKEDKWYEKLWQTSFGKASMSKTVVANTGTLIGDTLSAVTRQLVQRPFGTMKMTADDLAEYSKIPDVTKKIDEYKRGLYQPKGEFKKLLPLLLRNMPPLKEDPPDKAPPLEWLYDFIGAVRFYPHDILRTIDGTARALGQGVTLKDILILGLDNFAASRMFYSMGENDYQKKQVFLDRVRKGEDANLVAFDMEQPLSQLAGYAVYDPLNLFDLYGKAAKTSSRIASAAQRSGTFIPELQNVTESFIELEKAGEATDVARMASIDNIVPSLRNGISRIRAGITKLANKQGMFVRVASAKRAVAMQRVGLFGDGVAALLGTPDKATDVFIQMVKLTSENDDEVRFAVEFLSDALPQEIAFSEDGLEFAVVMSEYMGGDPRGFLKGVQEFADAGDIDGLASYTLERLEQTLKKLYPSIDELIKGEKLIAKGEEVTPAIKNFFDEGGKIRTIDRLINRGINQGFLGNLQRSVSGRAFIGMRAGPAARGAIFDTLLSTIDLGPGVHINSPEKWGGIVEKWLKFEHPGLMQGFSKTDIAALDTLASGSGSSYKDMGSLLDAIVNKGMSAEEVGIGEKLFETITNPGGRAMQWFELKNSQKIIGKAVDSAMRHLIKKTMPSVDDLIKAGLDEKTAKGLIQNIINQYGDVDVVKASTLKQIREGFVSTFEQMDWVPDDVKKVFDDFNVLDEIEKLIYEASSQDELTRGVDTLLSNLLSRTDAVSTQHAEILVDTLDSATDIGTALGGMARASDEGIVGAADFAEVKDHIQANKNVAYAIDDALRDLQGQAIDDVNHNPNLSPKAKEKAIDEVRKVFKDFKNPMSDYVNMTGKSGRKTDAAWDFTDLLRDSETNFADLKIAIQKRFKISEEAMAGVGSHSGSRKNLQDLMWRHVKSQIKAGYSATRQTAVSLFDGIIKNLQSIRPGVILNDSPLVQAVHLNELVARQMDTAVMVGDVMKPVGGLIRAYENMGDSSNAARGVASLFDPYIGSFKAGYKGDDLRILRIVNQKFPEKAYANLADVPVEDVFQAYRDWRANQPLPDLIDSLDDLVGYADEVAESIADVPNVNPPVDDSPDQIFGRDVLENQDDIEAAFQILKEGIVDNFGSGHYIDAKGEQLDNLVAALDTWFTEAGKRTVKNRFAAASYGQYMRDFILHNYQDRMGVDALMSLWSNFHFWPSRTLVKGVARIPQNLSIINKYMQYRTAMEKLHAGMPEWYRYSLNSNELLGLHSDNPVIFNLENTINPFNNMMGGFDNPDKRVNWWSTLMDGLSQSGMGFPNPIIQYSVAVGLKLLGEDDAAALHGGRFIPITRQIKGATALLGINEGRGVELDPSIKAFSDAGLFSTGGRALGPYEEKRVANALAQIAAENPDISEQALEEAWLHGGPLWDEAIARSNKKDATGAMLSEFTGVGAKIRSEDDIKVEAFWNDYSMLWATYANIPSDKFRTRYAALMEKYPFAPFMLLARKGGEERDRAYAYAVLSRIEPSKTDDISKAAGFNYDVVADFYDNKGDLSKMNIKDAAKFMTFISELGATLALPDSTTRAEWNAASDRYKEMRDFGEMIFGEGIWDRVELGYDYRETGLNQSAAFQNYLKANPDVEQVMDWQSKFILEDPLLAMYYASQDSLRNFWIGRMYDKLEGRFGEEIRDKVNYYNSLVGSGQSEEAKVYRNANLKAYFDMKEELNADISNAMIAYGNKLPQGESTRIRKDLPEDLSTGEQDILDYLQGPEVQNYTQKEWRGMLEPKTMQMILLAWELGDEFPNDLKPDIQEAADRFGMTYDELLISVGESGY